MSIATVTSKGQTTIPKEIRDYLGIKNGDLLDFIIQGKGEVLIKPSSQSLQSLRGLAATNNQASVSIDTMNKIIRERFKDKK